MIDFLKSVLLGAVPDSAAKSVNVKDIVASVRNIVAVAFWAGLSLFVFNALKGIEVHDWGLLQPVFLGLVSGLTKLAVRFFKDYAPKDISLPVFGGSRRVD